MYVHLYWNEYISDNNDEYDSIELKLYFFSRIFHPKEIRNSHPHHFPCLCCDLLWYDVVALPSRRHNRKRSYISYIVYTKLYLLRDAHVHDRRFQIKKFTVTPALYSNQISSYFCELHFYLLYSFSGLYSAESNRTTDHYITMALRLQVLSFVECYGIVMLTWCFFLTLIFKSWLIMLFMKISSSSWKLKIKMELKVWSIYLVKFFFTGRKFLVK